MSYNHQYLVRCRHYFSFKRVAPSHCSGGPNSPHFGSLCITQSPDKLRWERFHRRFNTSRNRWIISSLALTRHTFASFKRYGVPHTKFYLFALISIMCWEACASVSSFKFFATTTNCTFPILEISNYDSRHSYRRNFCFVLHNQAFARWS